MGHYWATGNNYDRKAAALHSGNWHQWITFIGQLGNTVESRSGCLAFFGQLASNLLGNWKAAVLLLFIGQLRSTVAKRLPCCFRVTGTINVSPLLGNCEQLRPVSSRLAFGRLASMDHVYWATRNYGREAAALHSGNWHQTYWATVRNNYDGREAAALLSDN